MGIPPTNNEAVVSGIIISRVSGGRVEEEWNSFDALGMMQQLGVIPRRGRAGANPVAVHREVGGRTGPF